MLMQGQGSLVLVRTILVKLANISGLVLIILLVALYFRDLLGIVGSGAIAASVIFIAGLFAAGYLLGGSQIATKGALGLATAARNIGAALVPASQNFSDSKIMLMVVCCTIVTLLMLVPTAAWLQRKRQMPWTKLVEISVRKILTSSVLKQRREPSEVAAVKVRPRLWSPNPRQGINRAGVLIGAAPVFLIAANSVSANLVN
jgi:hypothetical protein